MLEESFSLEIQHTSLAGTLTLPDAQGKHPAVIILSGGEPDNRDGGFFGFRPFRLIAEHLAEKGIATLRLDDPGVGESTGKHFWQHRFSDLETINSKVIDKLRRHANVASKKVGLIGFRQGGVIANLLASRNSRVAFVCNLGTAAVSGEKQIRTYKNYLAEIDGVSEEKTTEMILAFTAMNQAIRNGKSLDEACNNIININKKEYDDLAPEEKRHFSSFEAYFGITYDALLMRLARSPMYLDVLDFDPLGPLSRLRCPALLMFSENDPWVDFKRNDTLIRKSLSRLQITDFTIKSFKGVGQYFTRELTMPNAFAPGILDVVSDWICSKI